MFQNDVILENGDVITASEGNTIIGKIIECLRHRGLTFKIATFLLEEAKRELQDIEI